MSKVLLGLLEIVWLLLAILTAVLVIYVDIGWAVLCVPLLILKLFILTTLLDSTYKLT